MKIALINGSPKDKGSASESILQSLKPLITNENEIVEYHFKSSSISSRDLVLMAECNILVFAFPLYVDGIPAHLLSCLYQLEAFLSLQSNREKTVYALVNSGFYEGRQNLVALELLKNWCYKTKVRWGQGVGIGGGGMLPMLSRIPNGKGPKKNLFKALKALSTSILTHATADNLFVTPNFPKFAFKIAAEIGWCQQGKLNGLTKSDLSAQK